MTGIFKAGLGELLLRAVVTRTQYVVARGKARLDIVGMIGSLTKALDLDLSPLGNIAGMGELSLIGGEKGQLTHG